ncbi:Methyltransferase type 11 (fragment) [Shewanella benthica]|uniref:Methyltransferase type 11 n=1 Tax=Shewanella benthica TaxID=43661 RepID=A0A330LY48_9GAMM
MDVPCFISGNLARDSKYYDRVKSSEFESCSPGLYDFNFGLKLQGLLMGDRFEIVYFDNNVTGHKFNFSEQQYS